MRFKFTYQEYECIAAAGCCSSPLKSVAATIPRSAAAQSLIRSATYSGPIVGWSHKVQRLVRWGNMASDARGVFGKNTAQFDRIDWFNEMTREPRFSGSIAILFLAIAADGNDCDVLHLRYLAKFLC